MKLTKILATIVSVLVLSAAPACTVQDAAPRGVELDRRGDAEFADVYEDVDAESNVLVAIDDDGAVVSSMRPTVHEEGIELAFDMLDANGDAVTFTVFVAPEGASFAQLTDTSGTRRWDEQTDGGTIEPELEALLASNLTQWRTQIDARPELRQHLNASDSLKFRGFWCHVAAVVATGVVCGAFHIVPVAGFACDVGVGYLIDNAVEAKYDC